MEIPETFNVAAFFVDRNVSEGRGDKIAIECEDDRISYLQLLQSTNRAGNAFRNLDVRVEERVLLLLPDIPEFLYCFFGAIKIGAVAVPVSTSAKVHEYEHMLADSRAGVAVIHEDFLPLFQQIPKDRLRHLRHIVGAGANPPSPPYPHLQRLLEKASPDLSAEPTHKDDAAFWLYSSGSTGAPKGCVHLHHDMVVCSELYAKGILHMTERDRCYSVARLFFAYGLGNAGYFPLSVGAATILSPPRPTPETIYSTIERHRPTLFFSVPTNFAALLAHRRGTGLDFDLSSIRNAISAGEGLPALIFEQFRQRFGVEILDALGSTETLHVVIANGPGEARPGSSGKLIPGYEARITDENGNAVATDEIGDLLIRGDSTCAAYWNQHEKSKDTFAGHWFRTGDKYRQDRDGYFWHAGRSDDLFKVNGRWLSPVEVESALIAHPAVKEAAVIARDDEFGLAKPAAYVVTKSDYNADAQMVTALQQWVAEKLGGYKQPRWIEFLPEIPKTATGKLQRFKLRQLQKSS